MRAGFTQATLASRAGISERTVRNWESGVHETDAFSRKAIERVLSEPKPAKPGVAGFALAMPKPAKP